MPAPVTTPLPTPPSRSNPADFSTRADAFLGALPTFQSQLNNQASWMDTTSAAAVASAEAARDTALSYRNTASTHATTATTKASEAAASATAAANSATTANTHRTAAQTARTGAEAAATSANNALNDFNGKWYGSRATAPTGAIAEGAMFFNTTTGGLNIYKSGAWVGAVTASFDEIWSLIKNSDGAGSGLDADTLDGKQASGFVNIAGYDEQQLTGKIRAKTEVGSISPYGSNYAAFALWQENSDGTITEKARVARDSQAIRIQARSGDLASWASLNLNGDTRTLTLNGEQVLSAVGLSDVNAISGGGFFRCTDDVTHNVTVSGSKLTPAGINSNGTVAIGTTTMSGTWSCRGRCPAGGLSYFVRVA